MKNKRRGVSILVALILLITMVPGIALADTTAGLNQSVTVTMQASKGDEGFDFMRQQITVRDGVAENYGYTVAAEDHNGKVIDGPTMFDALVTAHEQKYTDFKDNPKNYLDISSAGFITKAFGKNATSSGFLINQRAPMDAEGVGYNADTTMLEENALAEFYFLIDPYWMDQYTFFNKTKVTIEENKELTLNLKGFMAMHEMFYGTLPTPGPAYNEDEYLGVYPVNEDGSLGAELGSITGEDGSFTLPALETGKHVLTAMGADKDENLITLPWCEVEVLPAGTMARIEGLIDDIGTVTSDSGGLIEAARKACDALSDGAKELINNYEVLTSAEARYKVIMDTKEEIGAKPVKVKATATSYNSVKISWSKNSKAAGYELYRSTSKGGKLVNFGKTKTAGYTDKGLKTGRTYYYYVRSFTNVGSETFTGKLSAAASAKPVLGKTTLKVKSGQKCVKTTWKKTAGASGYQLYKATSKSGKYKLVKTTTKNSYINKKLKKGKAYYFKVRAYRNIDGKKVYGPSTKAVGARAK